MDHLKRCTYSKRTQEGGHTHTIVFGSYDNLNFEVQSKANPFVAPSENPYLSPQNPKTLTIHVLTKTPNKKNPKKKNPKFKNLRRTL